MSLRIYNINLGATGPKFRTWEHKPYRPFQHKEYTARKALLPFSGEKTREILLVSQIIVDRDRCNGDGACVAVCAARVLALSKEGFPEELPETRCILCGHCVAVCPNDALTHTGLPREEFLPASKELPAAAVIDGLLNSRRSVREFKNKHVARETLEALLDVARRAPTASNSQKLHWIVVGGGEKVRALSAEAVNWLRASGTSSAMLAQWESGYDFVLRGAPTVVVACAPRGLWLGKTGLRHRLDLP